MKDKNEELLVYLEEITTDMGREGLDYYLIHYTHIDITKFPTLSELQSLYRVIEKW